MKILYGPPGDSSRTPWFHALPDDPETASGTLWITATQRKREWVRDRFRAFRRRFPPRIHTFDEMVRLIYERLGGDAGVLPADAVRTVLLSVIRDPDVEPILNRFLKTPPGPGFIDETARQIDELQRHGMSPETLKAIPDTADGFGEIFHALFNSYQRFLRHHHTIDAGGMQVWVADRLRTPDALQSARFPWVRCIFDGFLELTPLQLDILQALDALMDTTLVWPGNPASGGLFQWMSGGLKVTFPEAEWDLATETSGSLSVGKGLYSDAVNDVPELANAAFQLAGLPPDCLPDDIVPRAEPGRLRIIERDTRLDEVTAIARDIRYRMTTGGLAWSDIGVTFPDLQTYAPTVRRIFARYDIPFNISQSLPLTGSPVFTSIGRLLRLTAGWHRADVLAVLGDSGLTGLAPETAQIMVRRMAEWSSEYKVVHGFDRWTGMLEKLMHAGSPEGVRAPLASEALEIITRLASVLETSEETYNLTNTRTVLDTRTSDDTKTSDDTQSTDYTQTSDDTQTSEGTQTSTMTGAPARWIAWLRRVLGKLEINRNIEVLQRMALNGAATGSHHFEYTRRAYNRLLEYFEAVEPFSGGMPMANRVEADMTLAEFRETLPRMLAGVDYQLTTQTGDRVQILGLLGIRGLTFRHVYFGGLTESAFPRRLPMSPFWSPEISDILLDKPANAHKTSAFADTVRVMSAPLETLTLSRPLREGDERLLPSSILSYLVALYPDKECVPNPDVLLSVRDKLLQEAQQTGPASDLAGIRVRIGKAIAGERRSGEGLWCSNLRGASVTARSIVSRRYGIERSFSASTLETWIKCPRKFFFEKILNLGEPDTPGEEVSPIDRGGMIHAVLNRFYRERLERDYPRIQTDEVDACAARIRQIATEEFAALGYVGEAAKRQYRDIVGCAELNDAGIAARFARKEAEGPAGLQPAHLEWSFGRRSNQPPFVLSDTDGLDVLIEGKIDRIDRTQGDAVIWDYKTGRTPGKKEILNFESIQIGLYMLAAAHLLRHPVNAGGYYQIPSRSNPALYTAIQREDSEIGHHLTDSGSGTTRTDIWPEALFAAYFQELPLRIGQIVAKIRHGEFPVTADVKNCDYCPFVGLCRRARETHHDTV